MKLTTLFRITFLPFFILFSLTLTSWSQDLTVKDSRFRVEFGGGCEYSFLDQFNQEFVKNHFQELYKGELNFGWSLTGGPSFQVKRFLKVGVDLNYRSYKKSGNVEDIHFEDIMAGGVNYHYSLDGSVKINNFGVGISTTLYFDQIQDKRQTAKMNFGLDLNASYVISQFRNTKTTYLSGSDYGYEDIDQYKFNYWNLRAGLNVRYNLNQFVFRAISFKTGWHQSLNATIQHTSSFNLFSDFEMDLSGFYAELCLEVGKRKK